mmetsp:Transcript_64197/g.139487  ORF Transcript_64197/g.139487 Transcript_64197/m.139487 type:complete len:635 (+) Transcript_64197:117-2021(+)
MSFLSFCRGKAPNTADEQRIVKGQSALSSQGRAVAKESNPPQWPSSVHVVEPDGKFEGDKQAFFDNIFTDGGKYSVNPWGEANTDGYGGFFNETGRDFDTKRVAVLLKPGEHKAKFNVGFYNSILGLGRRPEDCKLDAFEVLNGVGADGVQTGLSPGALNNFWRSVENLQTAQGRNIYYFVSQASPLRKVHVQGTLRLAGAVGGGIYDWGYASGGFTADSKVDAGVEFGGQQQFITRNSAIPPTEKYKHGAWSNVLVGCDGEYEVVPNQNLRATQVQTTERVAEKPYIVFEGNRYFLMVPQPELSKKGITWENYSSESSDKIQKIDFESVYVATEGVSTAAIINQKLADGKSVVFSPGIYKINEPIIVSNSNTVLLGLGMASVMPAEDAPYMDSLIFVKDGLEGVRISALLLEAGPAGTHSLLKWGTRKGAVSTNSGFMHDIFCRVGGDRDASLPEARTNNMVEINTDNVVGDNLWLWRADHEAPRNGSVKDSRNKVWNAMAVNGDNVIMYGLFAEHVLHDQVVWSGENGKTFFFQCELPYDVTQQNFGEPGYGGYVIGPHVQKHAVHGAGVYCFFADYDVHAKSGFKAPEDRTAITTENIFCVFLNGRGGINHVLNDRGPGVSGERTGAPNFL